MEVATRRREEQASSLEKLSPCLISILLWQGKYGLRMFGIWVDKKWYIFMLSSTTYPFLIINADAKKIVLYHAPYLIYRCHSHELRCQSQKSNPTVNPFRIWNSFLYAFSDSEFYMRRKGYRLLIVLQWVCFCDRQRNIFRQVSGIVFYFVLHILEDNSFIGAVPRSCEQQWKGSTKDSNICLKSLVDAFVCSCLQSVMSKFYQIRWWFLLILRVKQRILDSL